MVKKASVTGTLSAEGNAYLLELDTPHGRYSVWIHPSTGSLFWQLNNLPFWKQFALEVDSESGRHPELQIKVVNKALNEPDPLKPPDQSCWDSDLWSAAKVALERAQAELELFEGLLSDVESQARSELAMARKNGANKGDPPTLQVEREER